MLAIPKNARFPEQFAKSSHGHLETHVATTYVQPPIAVAEHPIDA
jgi:hypothetical protein